ncbi:hypothetical protein AB1Y20_008642 [Prymnesium parvum]|uniref:Uncharacterized protein n=1 Tax=Prymnesium parvum TaxID=97485 RepID=A0AB34ITM8_PRYPA
MYDWNTRVPFNPGRELQAEMRLLLLLALAATAAAAATRRPSLALAPAAPVASGGAAHAPSPSLLALRGGAVEVSSTTLLSYAVHTLLTLVSLGSVYFLATMVHTIYCFTRQPELSDSGVRNRKWDQLKDQLRFAGTASSLADGAAARYGHVERTEAARALVMSHARVLHDIIRADGPPKTQQSLKRLPGEEAVVDAALHETARRLVGRLPGDRGGLGRPATPHQAAVWAATAEYLSARIQSTAEEVQSVKGHEARAPDMSEAAAAAMRAVLAEIATEQVKPTSYFRQLKETMMGTADHRPATMLGP